MCYLIAVDIFIPGAAIRNSILLLICLNQTMKTFVTAQQVARRMRRREITIEGIDT